MVDFDQVSDMLRRFQEEQIAQLRAQLATPSVREMIARASKVVNEIGPQLIESALQAGREFVAEFGAAMPENWLALTNPQIFEAVDLMEETGWSLVWTPPAEVVMELLESPSREAQRGILLRSEGRILADLDLHLGCFDEPELVGFRDPIREALEAYRSGFFRASQALSAANLSSNSHAHLGKKGFGEIREAFASANETEAPIREFRWVAVQSALARTLADYNPITHQPERADFNRHATAHWVMEPQYRQVNALTALMLSVAVLIERQQLAQTPSKSPDPPNERPAADH